MKEKTINLIIAVLPLLDTKIGQVKTLVKHTVAAANPASVTLDLTDVDTCTLEERYLELIAEALQEVGICDPKPIAGEDCRFKGAAVKEFRRIVKLLDERTVRIAFGQQLVSNLNNAPNVRNAKALLQDGAVQCIRFRTAQEKKAYLLGVNHAYGWSANASLDEFGDTVSKASRTLPVEPA